MPYSEAAPGTSTPDELPRRDFLTTASSVAMAGGLIAGYGTFAAYAAQYLYPASPTPKGWLFAADVTQLKMGESFQFVTPAGDKVVIARQSPGNSADDFIALSETCPHLGCRVHWEPHNSRFFCPCHNGVFNPQGQPLEGPPAAANTPLTRFRLQVEGKLLYVEVELEPLPTGGKSVAAAHDSSHPVSGLA